MWIGDAIFKDLELVIVDDGSAEIIKSYAKKDKRIKYKIFPKNKGAIAAMQECYNMCSADYLALVSSDDVWELDKLEQQIPVLDTYENVGAVFGLPTFIDSNSLPIEMSKNEFSQSLKLNTRAEWMNFFFKKRNCVCHPTILIRKKCYEKIGFYNPTLRSLPDFEMWVRLFFNYDVKILNSNLIKFRKHLFNESGPDTANRIRNCTEYKQILNIFTKQIKTVKELKEIFPEYLDMFKVNKDILVPFYIAMIAMKRDVKFSKDFAFDILYKELEKDEVLKLVEKNNLYSLVQLSQDVVVADIYAINKQIKVKTYVKIPFLIKIEKQKSITISDFVFKIINIPILKRIIRGHNKSIYFFGIKIK